MRNNPMAEGLYLLGTKGGPSLRKGGPSPSASALVMQDQKILIDCGIGVSRSLVEAGIPLVALDAIFITHLHSDHLLELGPLIYTSWTSGLQRPLDVFGPVGLAAYWQNFLAAMAFDHSIRTQDDKRMDLSGLVRIHEFDQGPVTDLGTLGVTALRVDHPPVADCFALRFEGAGVAVVFSADTCFFPPLGAFAKGADILVHEAMLGAGIDRLVARMPGASGLHQHLLASHTMAEDVGKIAQAAGVGHLVLNHLVPADDPMLTQKDWIAAVSQTWTGKVTVGQDGLFIPLEGPK